MLVRLKFLPQCVEEIASPSIIAIDAGLSLAVQHIDHADLNFRGARNTPAQTVHAFDMQHFDGNHAHGHGGRVPAVIMIGEICSA
jgi:hypothetical protein